VYLAGNTVSNNLRTSSDAFQKTYGGMSQIFPRGDGFIAKFSFGIVGPAPARVNVVSGFNGTGTAGASLTTPFVVEVTDATGAVVPGVAVTFAATNATVNPATATTDVQGRASTVVTLGAAVGIGTVSATVAGLPVATTNLTINAAVPLPIVRALVNGASFTPDVSPGSWITLFIENSVTATEQASTVPIPRTLGGVRILVNGTAIPLYLVSPQQMNAQLPYEAAPGAAQAIVEINGRASSQFAFTIKQAAPGVFVFGSNRAVVQNVAQDGSVSVNTANNPAPAGSFILVYFTGQGPLDNAVASGGIASGTPLSKPTMPVTLKVGDVTIVPDFVGMTPGQIGLTQANVKLPADLNPGEYPVTITIGGVTSNGPTISVTNPLP
jgi:uncharacterized protein (TIGR03437 family)